MHTENISIWRLPTLLLTHIRLYVYVGTVRVYDVGIRWLRVCARVWKIARREEWACTAKRDSLMSRPLKHSSNTNNVHFVRSCCCHISAVFDSYGKSYQPILMWINTCYKKHLIDKEEGNFVRWSNSYIECLNIKCFRMNRYREFCLWRGSLNIHFNTICMICEQKQQANKENGLCKFTGSMHRFIITKSEKRHQTANKTTCNGKRALYLENYINVTLTSHNEKRFN